MNRFYSHPQFCIVFILVAFLMSELGSVKTSASTLNNFDLIGKYFNMTDKRILDRLLQSNHYDYRMRPEAKTVVNMSILLLSLSSPDESSVTYEIGFVMFLKWYDPRLRFEVPAELKDHEKDAIYLNGLNHADLVWTPNIYFIKHGEFKQPTDKFDPLHLSLKIYPNGTVLCTTQRNMILTCEGNLKIFPFDSPKCFFSIESISDEKDQLELNWDELVPIQTSVSLKTMNAYMVRNDTNRCNKRHTWRREYSCLTVLLVFSRDQYFYLSTVFVPGMVLVTSSFISFWLDVNAVPARVMISVTTMLNFCTTTNNFRSKLPVVSNLNAMNLWDFVCMFFIYASMIEFIIVNYIYRQSSRKDRNRSFRRLSVEDNEGDYSFRGKSIKRQNTAKTDNIALHYSKARDNCELKYPLTHPTQEDSSTITAIPTPSNEIDRRSRSPNRNIESAQLPTDHNHRRNRMNANQSSEEGMSMSQMKNFLVDWIRKPYLINQDHYSSKVQLARSIDHISKTAFTLLFGLFSFFYFLTYAFIKPAQLEDWIEKEFEAID